MTTELLEAPTRNVESPFAHAFRGGKEDRPERDRSKDDYDNAVDLHTAVVRFVGLGMAADPCSPRLLNAYNELVWKSLGVGQAKQYEFALDERVSFGDLRQRTRKLRAILESTRAPVIAEDVEHAPAEPEDEEVITPNVVSSFVSTLCGASIVFLVSAHIAIVCF